MTGLRTNLIMKLNKENFTALHLGQGNPGYKHRLGQEWLESSPEEDLGVLVSEKPDMTQQSAVAAQKDNQILGCTQSSLASR